MYENLKKEINDNITTNGQGAITGAKLNSVLTKIVNQLGYGSTFGGCVYPDWEAPVGDVADYNMFYLAGSSGTYTNFDGIAVADGEVAFLRKERNDWVKCSVTPRVVTLQGESGKLTAEQMALLTGGLSFIVNGDNIYIKAYEDSDYIIFTRPFNPYLRNEDEYAEVTHSIAFVTKQLLTFDMFTDTFSFYTKTGADALFSAKAERKEYVDADENTKNMGSGKVYRWGEITGAFEFPRLVNSEPQGFVPEWCFTFSTSKNAPTVTWPDGIDGWHGGLSPLLQANKRYQVFVLDGIARIVEADRA